MAVSVVTLFAWIIIGFVDFEIVEKYFLVSCLKHHVKYLKNSYPTSLVDCSGSLSELSLQVVADYRYYIIVIVVVMFFMLYIFF